MNPQQKKIAEKIKMEVIIGEWKILTNLREGKEVAICENCGKELSVFTLTKACELPFLQCSEDCIKEKLKEKLKIARGEE